MPFDSNTFLRDQGWEGPGRGLREGALSKPLAPAQKRTLAGLGKDRDEAFPFWDHVYSAAASAIKLHLDSDSDEDKDSDLETTSNDLNKLRRTTTGIISNKRPIHGISATPSSSASGTSTPADSASGPVMSVMSVAKREAAKRNLYSRFFRGPLVGPDDYLAQTGEAGPSSPEPQVATITKTVAVAGETETTEERKALKLARRAERATREARKADRQRRREKRAAQTAISTPQDISPVTNCIEQDSTGAKMLATMALDESSSSKNRHKSKAKVRADDAAVEDGLKAKKKRKRKEES